ncbi:ATP-binding cassette sub-family B member 10, mitochondrial [Culex quinquefasciatus]|uniref:ATP-binding cassette sub-family B member 10, mitochondrial n=1 Tax=Culex quinquefasciatus TaxID=7176 RepID=B0W6R5_CULQU|nr:ATP-binding cassette sub-family B member 10, mitochondrial [Culex quinquefasciatus]|eukprot:XP_001844399.1 ATP-binding cassette sub-family B member 10, mitochondrial [Culex quinquefasciatus]
MLSIVVLNGHRQLLPGLCRRSFRNVQLALRHYESMPRRTSAGHLRVTSAFRNATPPNQRRLVRGAATSSSAASDNAPSSPPVEKQAKATKVALKSTDVKRLLEFAKPERWNIAGGVSCLMISSAITMSVPFGLGKILDIIYSTSAETALRITKNIRSKVYSSMLNQEAGWFDQRGTGELVNRLSSDTYQVGNSLSMNLSDGLRSTAMILAGAGMMVYTSPQLALVGMCIVPCVAGVAVVYGRFVRNITKELTDKFADVMKVGEERLGNIKTVKMFCKEMYEKKLFTEQLIDALNIGYRETKARATFYGMTGLSGNIIILSVLYYGGTMVSNSEMTVGALTSFILYAGYTAISIGGLSNFYTELNKGVGSATRLWEIIDRKHTIPVEGGLELRQAPSGEIVFNSVHFNYPSRPDAAVLSGLSLRIEPATSTAVVGRSGSGKSTLASLLLRLYDPNSGSIQLDGHDLRELNPMSLRSYIGAEPILFSGSIRENILYGLNMGDRVSESTFERVVREAHVHEFAQDFPQGLDTLVGQRGVMLSGGQKQRVAIARAIIRNPKILILDEATSALDAVSEQLIQDALENLTKNRTVLTIAHRLSTIRNATNIAVLQDGKIVEHGNYLDLMAMEKGIFKELVQRQTFSTTA